NNKSEIPSVMRAAQQTNFGNIRDVLTLSDNVPVPRELSSKEILIRKLDIYFINRLNESI
ncbi:unnamed protein product, partial [Adineta steineri]